MDEDNFKLPYKVQGAIWRAPKAKHVPRREDYQNDPMPFGNPAFPGYGGGEWPFDRKRAYTNSYYRNGILKTIRAGWADGYWSYMARIELQKVVDDLMAASAIAYGFIEDDE